MKVYLLSATVLLLLTVGFHQCIYGQDTTATNRLTGKEVVSVWHWGSQTRPYGINHVVVDSSKEVEVLASYKKNHITRVYGGYLRMPSTPDKKEAMQRWLKKLHTVGIQPVYLIGSPKWVYPQYRKDMLAYIINNYIKYNQSVKPDERLVGVHLDIEPHGLEEWSKATIERKREIMGLLKDAYRDARKVLADSGMGSDELMADIPFWYDSKTAVGWTSDKDRKAWFADAANYLNGFSIMNYQNSSVATLIDRAKWERDNFKGVIEIGLDSDDVGTTWKTKEEFRQAVIQLILKTKAPVAIHRYVNVMYLQRH